MKQHSNIVRLEVIRGENVDGKVEEVANVSLVRPVPVYRLELDHYKMELNRSKYCP